MPLVSVHLGEGTNTSFWFIFGHTGPLVRVVLAVLAVMSVISWAIIIAKLWKFRKIRKETINFLARFHQQKSLSFFYKDSKIFTETPLVYVFRAGYGELLRFYRILEGEGEKASSGQEGRLEIIRDGIYRAMYMTMIIEKARLERWLSFLASTGSSAPFIGLFGTVWGIMNSFRSIGLKGAANLAVVAPGIAEALIATAIGLATAIPAVIAYNAFVQKTRFLEIEVRHFIADFMRLVERDLVKRMGTSGSKEKEPQISRSEVTEVSL